VAAEDEGFEEAAAAGMGEERQEQRASNTFSMNSISSAE
jgi:hypothetical protein